jgi:hypothetical protein
MVNRLLLSSWYIKDSITFGEEYFEFFMKIVVISLEFLSWSKKKLPSTGGSWRVTQ